MCADPSLSSKATTWTLPSPRRQQADFDPITLPTHPASGTLILLPPTHPPQAQNDVNLNNWMTVNTIQVSIGDRGNGFVNGLMADGSAPPALGPEVRQ